MLTILFLLVTCTFIFVCFISHYEQKQIKNQKINTASIHLRAWRHLMWLFQQHRGKSTAFLNGDETTQKDLLGLEAKITEGINSLKHAPSKNRNWQATIQLWQELSKHWQQKSVEDNFKLHNTLIKQLIFAIEDEISWMASFRSASKSSDFEQTTISLLNTIEFVGQTRAIGTSVTASRKCESITKIRLCYLSQKLQQTAESLQEKDVQSRQKKALITAIIQQVQERLLPAQNLMTTKAWFDLCTDSIDGLYTHFDKSIDLGERIGRGQ
ncbi:nitrate- and nitrite sensing domain-containing protein [Planctobacterium marinum]|uniref:Nitrate/nitrite sensing protein domain-containing protein n=1 Tax=Planctobacterium marinum TaxID=1631968 RepID=A0AA48HGY7_9ALTE|nr:hypothetical protein MACH26_17370 [Planctobacterium marinum]